MSIRIGSRLVLVFVLALVSVLALDIRFWSLGCRFQIFDIQILRN